MSDAHKEPIRPDLLAERFAAAARGEDEELAEQLEKEPHYAELLRTIQWFAFQPGGLIKMAKAVLAAAPEGVVTDAMKKAGPPGHDGQWSLSQALVAWKHEWKQLDDYVRRGRQATRFEKSMALEWGLPDHREEPETAPSSDCPFDDWLAFYFDPELTEDRVSKGAGCDKTAILRGLRRFNHAHFRDEAAARATERLPGYLYDLCTLPNMHRAAGPSWFPDVIPVLLTFLLTDQPAREKLAVAETEVSKLASDVLDDTWKTKGLGRITGKSGFGKSATLKAECRAYPGRWRLVEAPLGDSLPDLIRAVGEALGMAFPYGRLRPEDRQKVEFSLRHMQPGIVIDEAHRLCPEQFNRNSIAERYNWVRWAIVDQGLPCVLSMTFQTNRAETTEERESRFVRTTGFNMEQFARRITREVHLPAVLSRDDFMAVARHHCGKVKAPALNLLVDAAMASPSGLGLFGTVKLRALRLAERRGSQEVALRDFSDAIAEAPGIPARSDLAASESPVVTIVERTAKPARQRRKSPAETLRGLRPGKTEPDFSVSQIPAERLGGLISAPALEAV